jgi:O-antigen/teichoic acid export membrane protein
LLRAIAGNFFTKAWTALLGIIAVPFLPRFLGPEAFGIVSFVLVVQSAVNLLDFGLSNSITRQVALHRAAEDRDECIGTVRTLEAVYWAIGALIAAR